MAMSGFREKIFRIVQKTDVQRRETKSIQRERQLVSQKLRMNAMPDTVSVLHHIRVRPALPFSGFRELDIMPLHIPDLRDDDHFLATKLACRDELRENGSHETLTLAIHIVC